MKKNITINMFGRLYSIDEDAYHLLQQYIDTLRGYFSHKPDGKEITDDIEARIAELFDDLNAKGVEAITIEHVQDIISRIGDPKQMEDVGADETDVASGEDAADQPKEAGRDAREKVMAYFDQLRKSNKRLYRDPTDKKISGLLAGCAHFFGGDPLWWRVGFALLILLTFWSGTVVDHTFRGLFFGPLSLWLVALYGLMAILTPVARNPEDRLMMKGVDVTPRNLAQEVTQEHTQTEEPQPRKSGASGCLARFFKVILLLCKALLAFVGLMAALAICAAVVVLVLLLISPDIFGDARFAHLYTTAVSPSVATMCLVGLLGLLGVSAYCLIHAYMSGRQKIEPMGLTQRLVWIALWMLCLLTAVISGVTMIARFSQAEDKLDEVEDQAYVKANTHGGVFIDRVDWDFLNRGGWQLIGPTGGRNDYTSRGKHFSGKRDMRYLHGYADWGLSYQVEHSMANVVPGTYTLTVAARTDGKGAFVYVVADGRRYLAEIPVSGEKGGDIWMEAKRQLERKDSTTNGTDRQYYQDIADANGGRGYGWNRVTIEGIKVTRGNVSYGVSTKSSFTNVSFGGQWVSAADFAMKKE
ncbi:MAG: PspC domain-containing protein [Prevotella sp.]|nr:PspC domain-containing protein [Prevotella sp.]